MRYVLWEDIFKLSASALVVNFLSILTPYLRISAAYFAAIVYRNQIFGLYQQKSSESKVKFRQASSHYKYALEAAKLAYANKTKESITSQKDVSWRIANSILNKGRFALPPQFNGPKLLFSASDKAKFFAKNFYKNSGSGISLPVFSSRTNLNLYNIFVTLLKW